MVKRTDFAVVEVSDVDFVTGGQGVYLVVTHPSLPGVIEACAESVDLAWSQVMETVEDWSTDLDAFVA